MASELEVGKVKIAATDGQFGLVHENASGIKVGTDTNTTIGFIGTISNHPLKLMTNNGGQVTIDTTGHVAIADDKYYQWGGTNARIVGSHSGDYVKILTGNSAKLTVDSTGLATFTNGIAFQSATTGSGTGTGYTLDKYEEGTFTGSLTAATPPTSVPTATGNYTRVGNLVHFQIKFNNANTTGASGQMEITGLPFTAANNNDSDYSPVNVIFYNLPYSNSEGIIYTNESKIRFYNVVDGAAWNNYSISAGSGKYLWISGTYKV